MKRKNEPKRRPPSQLLSDAIRASSIVGDVHDKLRDVHGLMTAIAIMAANTSDGHPYHSIAHSALPLIRDCQERASEAINLLRNGEAA